MPTEHRSRQTARAHHRLPTRSARQIGATATSGGGRPASGVESEGAAGRPPIHSLGGGGRGAGPPIEEGTHPPPREDPTPLPTPLVRDALLGRFAVSGTKRAGKSRPFFHSRREPPYIIPPISGIPAPAPTGFFSGG